MITRYDCETEETRDWELRFAGSADNSPLRCGLAYALGKVFDDLLPTPPRLDSADEFEFPDITGAAEESSGSSPIPEDPEEAPVGLGPA